MVSLSTCQNELRNIISELESIESEIWHSASNIGEDKCVLELNKVLVSLRNAQSSLSRVDPNNLAEWFLKKMGLMEED